ncbi:MAG TPA: glycopeptide resistance accessory protein VanW [Candidatus Cryosericum sp.]|nr:glycopeptide resistance accessory protein VanW [Candidatus Cryosericum sp.]
MTSQNVIRQSPLLRRIRKQQRIFCFYAGMLLDHNRYCCARSKGKLPCLLFETSCPLYNSATGFDMAFQENKVFNLKLAAARLDGVVIRPGETFSFWYLARNADRRTPYRDGLVVINGKLTTAPGGGLCQMSNSLFWMFLNSPLTIVERHGHAVKDFPEPPSDAPNGVDATISEGWLDLKVKNETDAIYQIGISFDEAFITARIYASRDDGVRFRAVSQTPRYIRENGKVIELVDIVRQAVNAKTGALIGEELLYRNRCEIGYPLPEGTIIESGGDSV